VPAVATLIDEVVAPVLQCKLPVAVVDKIDGLLQLLNTVTTGTAGVVFNTAVPVPATVVQPNADWVTL
jgi:hypothetical protein